MSDLGYLEGDLCGRNGCTGIITLKEPDSDGGCTCFLCPPCSYCMTPLEMCEVCDWDAEEEEREENRREYEALIAHRKKYGDPPRPWIEPFPKWDDGIRLKYNLRSMHGAHAQYVEGTYPSSEWAKSVGLTDANIAAWVIKQAGTYFGGRWETLGHGRFCYIRYTD